MSVPVAARQCLWLHLSAHYGMLLVSAYYGRLHAVLHLPRSLFLVLDGLLKHEIEVLQQGESHATATYRCGQVAGGCIPEAERLTLTSGVRPSAISARILRYVIRAREL